jgi:hypothetical protein
LSKYNLSTQVVGLEDFAVGKQRTRFMSSVRNSVVLRTTDNVKKTVVTGLPHLFVDLVIQVFEIQFANASLSATGNSSVSVKRIPCVVSEGSRNVLD